MFTKRQQEIINATMHLLRDYGMKSVTTRKIAEMVKIKEASLYNHFASKEKIFEGLIDYLAEVASSDILHAYSDKTLRGMDTIEKGYLAWCALYKKNPAIAYIIINGGAMFREHRGLLEKITALRDSEFSKVLGCVKQAQKEGEIRKDIDARAASTLIAGVFTTLVINWMNSTRDFDLVSEGKFIWKNLKKMLAAA
jgi:TetR/AcrR family transcriptional regulator